LRTADTSSRLFIVFPFVTVRVDIASGRVGAQTRGFSIGN
jgi:hypothetical protein